MHAGHAAVLAHTLHDGQPCPVCSEPIQRIRYADNETNYCARCQNGGVLLADRGLSRLLKGTLHDLFSGTLVLRAAALPALRDGRHGRGRLLTEDG